MSVIDAKLVKALRDKTSAGMMECKAALIATNGDLEQAIAELRKTGKAKAAQRAGRVASQGVIISRIDADHKYGMLLEVNSETDFVARESRFVDFANQVGDTAWHYREATNVNIDINGLLALPLWGDTAHNKVEDAKQLIISTVGENIIIRRIVFSPALQHPNLHTVGHYLHGGRIGVLVTLDINNQDLAKDLAMHIAANRPLVINPEDLAPELLAKEKDIYMAQANASGKPMDIIEKIVAGKLSSFANEVSLLGQPFIKNPELTVGELLRKNGAMVLNFQRLEVGEVLESLDANTAEQ